MTVCWSDDVNSTSKSRSNFVSKITDMQTNKVKDISVLRSVTMFAVYSESAQKLEIKPRNYESK